MKLIHSKVVINRFPPITYAKNQKEYFGNILKDRRIQLSNNLAEQSVKPFVIGRKNWLFSNNANGANASVIICSVIQTALLNNLKPEKYLEYVFNQFQTNVDYNVKDLMPWSEIIPETVKINCKNSNYTIIAVIFLCVLELTLTQNQTVWLSSASTLFESSLYPFFRAMKFYTIHIIKISLSTIVSSEFILT